MAWDNYEYRRPHTSPAMLVLAVVAGISLGAMILFYVNNGFTFQKPPPDALPRPAEPKSELDYEEMQNRSVFNAAKDSVVNVDTLQNVLGNDMSLHEQRTGTGSGIIWDDLGHIVTNHHVVAVAAQNRGKLRVVFADRTTAEASIVGTVPDYDLAVIKVNVPKEELKPIRVGTSKDLEVGQKAFAIGNPYGLSLTMTKGIISALDREIESPGNRAITGAIQTDAAINPGNSGGPLLDKDGRLIGVNASIATPSGGNVGIGFAIPVDTVNDIVPKLIAGRFLRPDAGLSLVDQRFLTQSNIFNGAMVSEVVPNGPADKAGLKGTVPLNAFRARRGDLILAVDGKKISSNLDFQRAIASKNVGDKVTFTIERAGKTLDVELTLRGI